jgi:hypothetical protein
MRLPHSENNIYPGIYFISAADDQKFCDLVRIESAQKIMLRKNGKWILYPEILQLLKNLPEIAVEGKKIISAISYVDAKHSENARFTWEDIEGFQYFAFY